MKTKLIIMVVLTTMLSLVFSGVVLAAGDPGWPNPPTGSNANQPENWEAWALANGETWFCNKIEDPPFTVKEDNLAYFTMPAPNPGNVWRLLKVKAGTVDTLYWDPVQGNQYPSDRDSISHVILCQMASTPDPTPTSPPPDPTPTSPPPDPTPTSPPPPDPTPTSPPPAQPTPAPEVAPATGAVSGPAALIVTAVSALGLSGLSIGMWLKRQKN